MKRTTFILLTIVLVALQAAAEEESYPDLMVETSFGIYFHARLYMEGTPLESVTGSTGLVLRLNENLALKWALLPLQGFRMYYRLLDGSLYGPVPESFPEYDAGSPFSVESFPLVNEFSLRIYSGDGWIDPYFSIGTVLSFITPSEAIRYFPDFAALFNPPSTESHALWGGVIGLGIDLDLTVASLPSQPPLRIGLGLICEYTNRIEDLSSLFTNYQAFGWDYFLVTSSFSLGMRAAIF